MVLAQLRWFLLRRLLPLAVCTTAFAACSEAPEDGGPLETTQDAAPTSAGGKADSATATCERGVPGNPGLLGGVRNPQTLYCEFPTLPLVDEVLSFGPDAGGQFTRSYNFFFRVVRDRSVVNATLTGDVRAFVKMRPLGRYPHGYRGAGFASIDPGGAANMEVDELRAGLHRIEIFAFPDDNGPSATGTVTFNLELTPPDCPFSCNGECIDPNNDARYCGASAWCEQDPGEACDDDEVCLRARCATPNPATPIALRDRTVEAFGANLTWGAGFERQPGWIGTVDLVARGGKVWHNQRVHRLVDAGGVNEPLGWDNERIFTGLKTPVALKKSSCLTLDACSSTTPTQAGTLRDIVVTIDATYPRTLAGIFVGGDGTRPMGTIGPQMRGARVSFSAAASFGDHNRGCLTIRLRDANGSSVLLNANNPARANLNFAAPVEATLSRIGCPERGGRANVQIDDILYEQG